MKRTGSWLALASLHWASRCPAVSFNDIEFWTGSGTNRAALVVKTFVHVRFLRRDVIRT